MGTSSVTPMGSAARRPVLGLRRFWVLSRAAGFTCLSPTMTSTGPEGRDVRMGQVGLGFVGLRVSLWLSLGHTGFLGLCFFAATVSVGLPVGLLFAIQESCGRVGVLFFVTARGDASDALRVMSRLPSLFAVLAGLKGFRVGDLIGDSFGDAKGDAVVVTFSSFAVTAAGATTGGGEVINGGEVFSPSGWPSHSSSSTVVVCDGGGGGGIMLLCELFERCERLCLSTPWDSTPRDSDLRFRGRPRVFFSLAEAGGSSAGYTLTVVVTGAGADLFTTHQSSSLSSVLVNRGEVYNAWRICDFQCSLQIKWREPPPSGEGENRSISKFGAERDSGEGEQRRVSETRTRRGGAMCAHARSVGNVDVRLCAMRPCVSHTWYTWRRDALHDARGGGCPGQRRDFPILKVVEKATVCVSERSSSREARCVAGRRRKRF